MLTVQISRLFCTAFWNFDLLHVFLPLTITELSTLKQVRFFLAHPVVLGTIKLFHKLKEGHPERGR